MLSLCQSSIGTAIGQKIDRTFFVRLPKNLSAPHPAKAIGGPLRTKRPVPYRFGQYETGQLAVLFGLLLRK
jgi:hypothetical protein